MANNILHVIETAYRATIEEQDDTTLWLTRAMRGAGAQVDVLLRGAAVAYAARGQDASGIVFGDRRQTRPPRIADDLAALIAGGALVLYVEEDAVDRGIVRGAVVDGIRPIARTEVPRLHGGYRHVFYW